MLIHYLSSITYKTLRVSLARRVGPFHSCAKGLRALNLSRNEAGFRLTLAWSFWIGFFPSKLLILIAAFLNNARLVGPFPVLGSCWSSL